jgi:glycerol-1-phosphate dehydrogenase [NAD(P)+]
MDLDGLRAALRRAPDAERLQPIGLDRVHIGRDALDGLPVIVTAMRRSGDVVLLMDDTPMRRGTQEPAAW